MDPVLQTIPSRTAADLPQSHSARLKPLWIAIGVLGAAVVALGGTLVYEHVQAPLAASAVPSTPMASLSAPVGQVPPAAAKPPPVLAKEEIIEDKAPPVPVIAPPPPVVQAPRVAMAPAGVPTYTPAGIIPPGTYSTAPGAPNNPPGIYSTAPVADAGVIAGAPVCADCGRIESVSAVHRAAPTSGVGAVAGGVLGAVIGNQFGHGGGRTATTLLGAGGGAYLGNRVEANSHTRTVYMVHVRMDNGTRRTFERAEPVQVGQLVTVQGHGFRLGRGETYSTAGAPQQAAPAAQPGTYSTVRN